MNNKLFFFTNRFTRVVLISLVLLVIISFALVSCKKSSTTGPGDTGGGEETDLLGTRVIGLTGGEINLDSIIVKVPSGAFNENNELSVYVGEENDGFNEYGSSALYQITGLPTTINKPIKLSIKYNGTLEGDTLVAVGEMGYAVSLDSSLFSYHTEKAKDSLGYLVYELPTYSSLAKIAGPTNELSKEEFNIIVLNTYIKLLSSDKNFRISVPIRYYQDGIRLGDHFETAFRKCKAMGFSYPVRVWPVDVIAKPIEDAGGYYSHRGETGMSDERLRSLINKGNITIGLQYLTNDPFIRIMCGHEFLHLVQNLYEFSAKWIEPEQNWLKEATSVWIEEKFTDVTDYVSHNHLGIETYPLWGWQRIGIGYARNGYGLSVIFKEISDRYGDIEIVKIFEKIKSGILPDNAVDPVEAVISVVEEHEPIEQFWHRTLSSYTLGEYYNKKVNFKFLDSEWSYTDIGPIDKLNRKKTIKRDMADLSGRLFEVKFGDISMLKKIPLLVWINDPTNCGLLVCKFKEGKEITSLGSVSPGGSGFVTIDDVKPFLDDGYKIIVLVTNSTHDKSANYIGNNEVELTVERLVVINNIEFRIQCEGSYSRTTNLYWANPGVDTTYYYDSRATISSFNSAQTIGIKGNTITLSADSTDQSGYTYKTDLSITLNNINEPTKITSFWCTYIYTYTDANTDTRQEFMASGVNIPITNTNNPLRFEVEGNISSNLNEFKDDFYGDFRLFTPRGYDNTSLLSYDGSTDGLIRFKINQGE